LRLLPELGHVASAARSDAISPPLQADPEALIQDALAQGAKVVVSTYNEPLITSEWAVAIFREARKAGLLTAYVSNGNGTPQVLEYLHPWIDLYKVDLKSFDDHHYRELGGRLQPILDTIRSLHKMGIWLEIVTLLIPGFNDSDAELRNLTAFLAGVSPDIPWHVTAFHEDYKMTSPPDTRPADLLRAATIGRERRIALHLRRQSSRSGPRARRYPLPSLRRIADPALGIFDQEIPPNSARRLPSLPHANSWPLVTGIRRPDRVLAFSAPQAHAIG
jgi:pyruvate-formate lyase-activating enzyme